MAEAVAIISLVASIASLVDLSAKVVSRLRDVISNSSEVPESFRSLSTRLPLLTVTLQHIQSQAEDGRFPADVIEALKAVVDDTSKQVSGIQTSLSKVLPSETSSKVERALKALKSLAKEDEIQRAIEKISKNNEVLVLHQTTGISEALSKLNLALAVPSGPSLFIPYRRDPDFVDRGDILHQLGEKCALPGSRQALVGFGGVGKSQLAIELSYRVREQSPETWVLWVHAGSLARCEQSFREIVDHIGIPGREDRKANVFQLLHDWLKKETHGRWLVILDNVDNADLFSQVGGPQPMSTCIPQSKNGSVLVTSRNKDVALKLVEEKDIITVQPMTAEHALSLLRRKLGPLDQGNDSAKLAEALEFMPLAIAQAAAYISRRSPRYSVQQYLEDYRKSDRKKTSLLDHEGGQLRRDWEAKNSIIITWQISFEDIRQKRPSASDLLSLMSFCDRQGIPEVLIRNRGEVRDSHNDQESIEQNEEEGQYGEDEASKQSEDDGFEDDVQTLRDYSFLSIGRDGTFEMHSLVQLATRKWLEANEQLEQWRQCYITTLYALFPTGEYENWASCNELFPHAKSAIAQRPKAEPSLKEWASLIHDAALYALVKGNVNEAIDLFEMAMKARKKIFGEEHQETLRSKGMIGAAYGMGGRWEKAEQIKVQVMEASKNTLGEEHIDTIASIYSLAVTYADQGRWNEAEQLQEHVMNASQRIHGKEHPFTLTSTCCLASIYADQGRWKEAEQLQEQVMNVSLRIHGKEHPFTLTSMGCLAMLYGFQGRWKEAEQLQAQVMEVSRSILGEEHPDTLRNIAHLAIAYRNQGRLKEAEQLQVQIMNLCKRILGEEHPDTVRTIANLALTYWDQGRGKEAEQLQVQVVDASKRILGEEHPNTLTSISNLASTYWNQGREEEAEKLHIQVIEASKRILGEEHPDTLERIADLASTYRKQGRRNDAEKLDAHPSDGAEEEKEETRRQSMKEIDS